MATVASLRTLIQFELPACPTPTVDAAILDACRAFSRDTHVVTYHTEEVTSANLQEYDISPGGGVEVTAIQSVVLDGSVQLTPVPRKAAMVDIQSPGQPDRFWFEDGQLWLYRTPDKAYQLSITAVTAPTTTASSVDDRYAKFSEAIRAHALYRLTRMPNVAWSDPATAELNRRLYRSEVVRAHGARLAGNSSAPLRVTPNFF